jgi:hypothetical protein
LAQLTEREAGLVAMALVLATVQFGRAGSVRLTVVAEMETVAEQ